MTDLGVESVPETTTTGKKRKPRAKKTAAPPAPKAPARKAAKPVAKSLGRAAAPAERASSAGIAAETIQVSGAVILIGSGNAKLFPKFAKDRAAQDLAGIRRIDLAPGKGGQIEFDNAKKARAFFDANFNGDLDGIDEDDYTWKQVPFDGKL